MPRRKEKWVRRHDSHLKTDYPTPGRCKDCGQTVYIGHIYGMIDRLDPYPLNIYGELDARRRGLMTYELDTFGHRLKERTASNIRRPPPKVVQWYALRKHVCGTPPPLPSMIAPPYPPPVDTESCPF